MFVLEFFVWALYASDKPMPYSQMMRNVSNWTAVAPVQQPTGTLEARVAELEHWVKDAVKKTESFANMTNGAVYNHRERIELAEEKVRQLDAKVKELESGTTVGVSPNNASTTDAVKDLTKKVEDATEKDYWSSLYDSLIAALAGGSLTGAGVWVLLRNLRTHLGRVLVAALQAPPPGSVLVPVKPATPVPEVDPLSAMLNG